jgi:drug/metabolite transporter (DMT)-like permease
MKERIMKKLLSFGPLFIIIAALLWAFDGVLRISLYSLPPSVIVFYEHVLGFIVLLLFLSKWIGELKKMSRKEWIAIIAVSLFSGALGTIFYTAALQLIQYTQYSVVVLLQQQLQPIWAILTAAILLKEKLTKRFALWAIIALIGAYFITFKDLHVNFATGSGTLTAGLLAIGAGFMWGSTTAVSKVTLNKVSHVAATALRFFFAPIFAFIFIVSLNQTSALFTLNQHQWLTLLLITFSTGMVAIVIYYYGLKKVQAKASAIYELAFPAAAVLIDFFYYHKTLSITQIFGILILILAMTQITNSMGKKETTVDKEN